MYNVNKGKNTLEESEVLEPVHNALRELLERERVGKPWSEKFTNHDVIAITLLYSLVMGNRMVHQLKEEKVGLDFSQNMSNYFAQVVQNTTLGMSGIDVKNYYKTIGGK